MSSFSPLTGSIIPRKTEAKVNALKQVWEVINVMNTYWKSILSGAALLAASAAIPTSVSAETTLTLSNWLPPSHPIVTDMITPWAEQIEEATNGDVKVRILAKPLGSPPAHFDIARDGLADITFGVHGYQPGRFTLTQAAEMPFLGSSAEAVSVAYWRVYEKYAMEANEHDGVKLLGLFTHGPGTMMSTGEPIDEIADLQGMKIRVGGGIVNAMSKELGVVGLLKPAPEVYEILSRGVADGVFFPMESLRAFKLEGIVKNITEFPGGFYNTSFFLVMNSDAFDGLSDEQKAAIEGVSGEAFARMAGQAWDAADTQGRAKAAEAGVNVFEAPEQLLADVSASIAPVESGWVDTVTEAGVDGTAMLTELREIAASIEAGN